MRRVSARETGLGTSILRNQHLIESPGVFTVLDLEPFDHRRLILYSTPFAPWLRRLASAVHEHQHAFGVFNEEFFDIAEDDIAED